ncbi:MAG: family 43 glycosylhydrolase, partial [bacterium]|nr:family 43 glycosylhydrolase [bacterium]
MNKNNYIKTEYNNPFMIQRADPYVYRHSDGSYYFTASLPEYDCIALRKSDSLDGLANAEETIVWRKHEEGIMSIHVWAPELHYLDDEWYIYFAAGDKDDIWEIRPYILHCLGSDPINDEWEEIGLMKTGCPFAYQDFSLDMTIFENKGVYYCVWAEKVSVGKKISNLYIARLKNPTELDSEPVLLSAPDFAWERVDFWVNEGP